jgi:hypothetical protein
MEVSQFSGTFLFLANDKLIRTGCRLYEMG